MNSMKRKSLKVWLKGTSSPLHSNFITWSNPLEWTCYATTKDKWSFQPILTGRQNCLSGGVGGLNRHSYCARMLCRRYLLKSVLKHLWTKIRLTHQNQFKYCMELYKETWLRRHYVAMTVPSLDVGVHVNVKVDASTSPLWVTQFWKKHMILVILWIPDGAISVNLLI